MRNHVRRSARLAALGVGLALPLAFAASASADGASDFGAALVRVEGTTLKVLPPLSPNSFMSARILQDPVGLGSAQPRLVVQANQTGRPVVNQRVAGRSLLVPLKCPAVRSEGCTGTLSATRLPGGPLGDEVAYRVRKGSTRTVAISLSPSQVSAVEGGRTFRITSRETTLDGRPRTTSLVTSLS